MKTVPDRVVFLDGGFNDVESGLVTQAGDLVEQILLGRVVHIHSGRAHPGQFGNLARSSGIEALASECPDCRHHQAPSGVRLDRIPEVVSSTGLPCTGHLIVECVHVADERALT